MASVGFKELQDALGESCVLKEVVSIDYDQKDTLDFEVILLGHTDAKEISIPVDAFSIEALLQFHKLGGY